MMASSTNFMMESNLNVERPETKSPAGGRGHRFEAGGDLRRDDVDELTTLVTTRLERDGAIDQGEQGVVAAEADANTCVELGTALADDDVAGFDSLATIDLNAQVLGVRVATVAAGTYAFLMCHDLIPPADQAVMPVISISV
jgi:hypothetical protein